MGMKQTIERIERRLRGRPGLVTRVERITDNGDGTLTILGTGEVITPEGLLTAEQADPGLLFMSTRVVTPKKQ